MRADRLSGVREGAGSMAPEPLTKGPIQRLERHRSAGAIALRKSHALPLAARCAVRVGRSGTVRGALRGRREAFCASAWPLGHGARRHARTARGALRERRRALRLDGAGCGAGRSARASAWPRVARRSAPDGAGAARGRAARGRVPRCGAGRVSLPDAARARARPRGRALHGARRPTGRAGRGAGGVQRVGPRAARCTVRCALRLNRAGRGAGRSARVRVATRSPATDVGPGGDRCLAARRSARAAQLTGG